MKRLTILFLLLSACGKTGDTGSAGGGVSNESTIISNQIINTYSADLCTQYTGEVCGFMGGQLVKWSDGSVLILGGFSFAYSNGTDSDSDQVAVTAILPPSQTIGGQLKLSSFVARGNGYKNLYLVYYRSGDVLKLMYDTNGDNTIGPGDETIATLSVSSW